MSGPEGQAPRAGRQPSTIARRRLGGEVPPSAAAREPDPTQAWRVLDQTTRWIVHADGKAGLILASAGVTGGALFSVVHGRGHVGVAAVCAGAVSALSVLAACLFAVLSLWSRVRTATHTAGLLHFGHVASGHPDSAAAYVELLGELTSRPKALADEIAAQVWVNSHIASRKYFWANLGLGSLICGLVTLGGTCVLLLR